MCICVFVYAYVPLALFNCLKINVWKVNWKLIFLAFTTSFTFKHIIFWVTLQIRKKVLLLIVPPRAKVKTQCLMQFLNIYDSHWWNFVHGSFSTHFQPIFHTYAPWKHKKTSGFQVFSRGIEVEHWLKMGQVTLNLIKVIIY